MPCDGTKRGTNNGACPSMCPCVKKYPSSENNFCHICLAVLLGARLLYMWDVFETLCEQFKAHLPRNNAALGLRHVPHAPVCVQFCLSASHRGIWDQLHGLRPSWALDTPTLRALSACTTLPDSTVALSECALS